MSTFSSIPQGTVYRLQLIASRILAGAVSPSESEEFERESFATAARLEKEAKVWKQIAGNQAAWSPARVGALLSLTAAGLHVQGASRMFLDGPGKLLLLHAATSWICKVCWALPTCNLPAGQRKAVAEALLRANVLHGCSRQLASLAEVLAPQSAMTYILSGQPPHSSPEVRFLQLLGQLVHKLCYLSLYEIPGPHPPDQAGNGAREDLEHHPDEVAGRQGHDDEGRQRVGKGCEQGGTEEVNMQQQQQQQRPGAPGAGPPPQTGCAPGLLQEMLSSIGSSCVLEHLSRCVLLLAGRLQGVGASGEGQGELGTNGDQQQQRRRDYGDTCLQPVVYYAGQAYRVTSTMAQSRGLLDGDCCFPADPGSCHPGAGHDITTADEFDTAPLGACNTLQGPIQVSLIRRVLSGPCTRHLVLCTGLNALSALDGGTTYGTPEGAGLQRLMPTLPPSPSEHQDQAARLHADSLLNLLTLLAMRPCDTEAEPPGRAMRLRLTLRVARAAVAVTSASRTGASQDGPHFYLTRGDAALVAVQALQLALRHMPPPGDGDGDGGSVGGSRRLQALRRWAALAEEVARKAAPGSSDGHWSGDVCRRLGLLLGLDPGVVRPETPRDLPALASGGHLLRGVEALVRQCVEEEEQVEGQEGERATAAGNAVEALAVLAQYAPGTWLSPLAHLLLRRGDDEPLYPWNAGQGQQQRQGPGQVGHGQGRGQGMWEARRGSRGLRAAASLAVALGKLLWRCEGQLADYVGECSRKRDAIANVHGSAGVLQVVGEVSMLSIARAGLLSAGNSRDGVLGGSGEPDEESVRAAGVRDVRGTVERQGQQQEERRQVWVCAFAAWRWLPALASLAGRTAAEGHVPLTWDHAAALAWQPLVWWTRKVCYRSLLPAGAPAREAGAVAGSCQVTGGGNGAAAAAAAAVAAAVIEGAGGWCSGRAACGCSSGCTDGLCSSRVWCGCWRDFLLRDVGVVELVGTALREVVPALPLPMGGAEGTGSRNVVIDVMDACVLLAAAFPEEVARAAGRLTSGGSGGTGSPYSGSSTRPGHGGGSSNRSDLEAGTATVWPSRGFARLMQLAPETRGFEPRVRALRLLEEWCGACAEAGEPVAFDEAQRAVLRRAAAVSLGAHCTLPSFADAAMLPPLCELRGLLRACSNPRCAVLPPPGRTEAEAAEEAEAGPGARLEACLGGCGAV